MASLEIMAGPPVSSASSAGVKKLVCRVCQKGFTKAEHLRVSQHLEYAHVPTILRGRYSKCQGDARRLSDDYQANNQLKRDMSAAVSHAFLHCYSLLRRLYLCRIPLLPVWESPEQISMAPSNPTKYHPHRLRRLTGSMP
jgi:hypothetical protein